MKANANGRHSPEHLGHVAAQVASRPQRRTPTTPDEEWEWKRRCTVWNSLVHHSIGPRHKICRLDNFEVDCDKQREALGVAKQMAKDIREHIEQGKNLLLYGPCGTGKDHMMVALLAHAILGAGYSAKWRYGADLFGELRDRIGSGLPEAEFLRQLSEPDVLAISDPVTSGEPLTAFQKSFLQRVVDHRYRWMRGTWMTLNVANRAEAEERLGVPTLDRLMEDRVAIFCDWPSYRLAKRQRGER